MLSLLKFFVCFRVYVYLKLAEFLFGDLIITSELFILSLVDEDNSVGLQKCLGEKSLRECLESGPDKRQVDTVNGDVVTGSTLASCLTTTINSD